MLVPAALALVPVVSAPILLWRGSMSRPMLRHLMPATRGLFMLRRKLVLLLVTMMLTSARFFMGLLQRPLEQTFVARCAWRVIVASFWSLL